MSLRFSEHHHNSDEQVAEYLSKALAVVDELELTDELRPVAFVKAVDLYAAKSVTAEQIGLAGLPSMEIPRG